MRSAIVTQATIFENCWRSLNPNDYLGSIERTKDQLKLAKIQVTKAQNKVRNLEQKLKSEIKLAKQNELAGKIKPI